MKKTILIAVILLTAGLLSFGINLNSQTVYNPTTVAQVNERNAELGLPWTAGFNKAFDGKTIQQLSAMNGYIELPKQVKTRILTDRLTVTDDLLMGFYTVFNPMTMNYQTLPTGYDLRNVNGNSYVSPIKDQGFHGACWAFSTTETVESAMMVQSVLPEYSFLGAVPVLSTQFTAYHDIDWDLYGASNYWTIQDSNYDAGGNLYFSLYNAVRYGIPPASDFPYLAYENSPWISWNPQTSDWKDRLVRTNGAVILPDGPTENYYYNVPYSDYIDAIKTMIMEYGSVGASFSVPADFNYYQDGVFVPATPVHYAGGHSIQIVGWIDGYEWQGNSYDVWIVRNSWGTSWGMNGYWLQPMATQQEYESEDIPAWKFESDWIFSAIFEPSSVAWQDADFNDDNVVNMTDFDMLETALNETSPSSATIAKYDMSVPKDYRIDGNDLVQFMYLWNEAAKVGH